MNSVIKSFMLSLAGPLALAVLGATAAAQPCTPHWETPAEVNNNVYAFCTFDDGTGPALYMCGQFRTVNGAVMNHVSKWDGQAWSPLGNGIPCADGVNALAAYNDGAGPALYAGGSFRGPCNPERIAKWDGTSWGPVGTGMNGSVLCLAAFDDGTGPALYAGGYFTIAGDLPASHIAKWNGQAWSPVGGGMNDLVYALTVFDDGTGPALYVGGAFTWAGSVAARYAAKWDGQGWSSVGGGPGGEVLALAVLDDGSGHALYAGGGMSVYWGGAGDGIGKWNGSYWSPLGSGVNNGVNPDNHIIIHGHVRSLAAFDDGTGSALYAGGDFTFAGDAPANHIARWDGGAWSALGNGMESWVNGIIGFDDGNGPALYMGADGTVNGSNPPIPALPFARWRACSLTCCINDYNGDGDTGTDADIEAFFACIAGDCCATCPPDADFNCDGDVGTDADIESFFRVLAGSAC
jgi:hypothetical protein